MVWFEVRLSPFCWLQNVSEASKGSTKCQLDGFPVFGLWVLILHIIDRNLIPNASLQMPGLVSLFSGFGHGNGDSWRRKDGKLLSITGWFSDVCMMPNIHAASVSTLEGGVHK